MAGILLFTSTLTWYLIIFYLNVSLFKPIGFGVLVIGMFLYNDVLILPFMRSQGWINDAVEDMVPISNKAENIDSK